MAGCGKSIGLLLTATVLLADPLYAWESDVHYGLTKWLAIQAGFSEPDAEIVSQGTWDRDHGINDPVHLVWHYACLGNRDVQAAKLVRDSHFPSFENLPADVNARAVEAGGKAASREALQEVQSPDSGNHKFDLEQFGAALHPLQDSWSHQGVPDPPAKILCDSQLSWGHPVVRGGYKSHDADLTFRWPEDTLHMAQTTYELMQAYLSKKDRPNHGKPWNEIEKAVKDFGALETKLGKERWFLGHGIKDLDFLGEITLEDGERPAAYVARLGRPSTKGLPESLKAHSRDQPPEVRKLFAALFEAWMTEKDFMRFQGKLKSLGIIRDRRDMNPPRFEGEGPDPLVAQLWIWRLRDHGLANKLGHGAVVREGKAGFDALMSATMHPGAVAEFKSMEQGLLPLGEGAPPYLIVTLPMEAKPFRGPDQTPAEPAYGALARFKNAPHDVVMVIASGNKGKLGVDGIYWTIDH